MAGYVCKNCGFRVASDRLTERCPYCDKKSLEREQDAKELLDDLEEA